MKALGKANDFLQILSLKSGEAQIPLASSLYFGKYTYSELRIYIVSTIKDSLVVMNKLL